jgi:hypothetical protein
VVHALRLLGDDFEFPIKCPLFMRSDPNATSESSTDAVADAPVPAKAKRLVAGECWAWGHHAHNYFVATFCV